MLHVPEKERAEDERMQHMSNSVLCDDGVSDMRRGWRRTPTLSMNGREQTQSVIIAAAAKTAVTI